ncbi:hypothetical protein C5Y96_25810 [Blastopirellula marina]|uniref:Uncharacterized protein n=1 Tax=Blastopirellula marina TaxID=124 RepID=A0A2S8EZI8_9BACT|nr:MULTISPECIES: hypothetical protein [Pirellulaceae]PQO25318.1 hypothetical protein C5Y96_25810 [Blastopirellula marina]RCS41751.1 hypothetical protein DTL36_25860 [Bremerella cremea]
MPIFRNSTTPTCLLGSILRLLALVLVVGVLPASVVDAQEVEAELVSFSREDKQDAMRLIPFTQMRPQDQNRVSQVVKDPSIFRRLPVQVIDCDPEIYAFLVSYPEVVVNIWELMGITNVQVRRMGPTSFHANDGAGTVSNVDIVYADGETNIFFAEGYYEGPLAPGKILANCVLVLQSGYTKAGQGQSYVSNRLDVFVKFESRGADLLARTLHPLIGKTADYNFAETSSFIGKISKNAEDNVTGMHNLVSRLQKIDPTVRKQFGDVVTRVYQRKVVAERGVQQQFAKVPDEDPLPLAAAPVQEPALLPKEPEQIALRPLEPAVTEEAVIDTASSSSLGSIPRKRFAELRR